MNASSLAKRIFESVLVYCLLLLPALCIAGGAEARGLALIIGNTAYTNINPIEDAGLDAHLLADTLTTLGVELYGGRPQLDTDHTALDNVVQGFVAEAKRLSPSDFVIFYFKGHGARRSGVSYLLPVDARPNEDVYGLDWNAAIVAALQTYPTKVRLLFIDACDNEVGTSADALGRPTVIPANTLISYSTQPDRKALTPSPYSKSLADHIGDPGVRIEDVLGIVQGEVKQQRPDQVPTSYGSVGDFFLRATPTITISSHDPDDVVTVLLDGKTVLSANIDEPRKATNISLPIGDSEGKIAVYNKKSRRNNQFWQPFEGWRYHVLIDSSAGRVVDMSGEEDSVGQDCNRHCDKTFEVGSFVLHVNRKTNAVTLVNSDPNLWKR